MQFKHPELLFALLLLLIPILIHLFQLRRFKKVAFTNVKFLKDIEVQTRKSSQLKKWLVLLTRMGLLACIVLAFAQPFTTNTDDFKATQETVIYLDNSFSMQAEGRNGSLLNTAVTSLLENVSETEPISLFTNDQNFVNTTLNAIKNDLIQLDYSTTQLPYQTVLLNGARQFSKDKDTDKNLMLISDFQQTEAAFSNPLEADIRVNAVQLTPQRMANVSIDSVAVQMDGSENLTLDVWVNQQGDVYETLPVSLFNADTLVAKTAVDFTQDAKTSFTIQANTAFKGMVMIDDEELRFDNTFYFNLNNDNRIQVLAISEGEDRFLSKIYTKDRFDYTSSKLQDLNYSSIANQNLVVVNALEAIPENLANALTSFVNNAGYLIIIPAANANTASYNQLINAIGMRPLGALNTNEKRITTINFSHPLLNNVFDKRVDNFQYPKVTQFYNRNGVHAAVLNFEDGQAFLEQYQNTYLFAAPLDEAFSNFKQSPLIVPVFYAIGEQSLKLPRLYYTIGATNTIDVKASLGADDILTLQNQDTKVIPRQQAFNQKVSITTDELPAKAGIVDIKQNEQILGQLSYNYHRQESALRYFDFKNTTNLNHYTDVVTAVNSIKSANSMNAFWKWFVIFALCFLVIELLILNYFK